MLHYNVPPGECAWSFEKCTEQFLQRTHLAASEALLVVDIPTSVLNKLPSRFSASNEGLSSHLLEELRQVDIYLSPPESSFHNPVYMEQSLRALTQLIQSQTPSQSSRCFAAEFYYKIRLLNDDCCPFPKQIQSLCRRCSTFASSSIRSLFHMLWINLYPPPFISLTHSPFGDDFYLRFQERLSLTESILLVLLANQLRRCFVEILSESDLTQLIKDIYKVVNVEILKILPCTEKLRVDQNSGISQIDGDPEKYGDM